MKLTEKNYKIMTDMAEKVIYKIIDYDPKWLFIQYKIDNSTERLGRASINFKDNSRTVYISRHTSKYFKNEKVFTCLVSRILYLIAIGDEIYNGNINKQMADNDWEIYANRINSEPKFVEKYGKVNKKYPIDYKASEELDKIKKNKVPFAQRHLSKKMQQKIQMNNSKYLMICTQCQKLHPRKIKSKVVQNPTVYPCDECGGRLKRIR